SQTLLLLLSLLLSFFLFSCLSLYPLLSFLLLFSTLSFLQTGSLNRSGVSLFFFYSRTFFCGSRLEADVEARDGKKSLPHRHVERES
ncbi:hypothetical protein CSUI_011062, partial [Cystoisospora suis]